MNPCSTSKAEYCYTTHNWLQCVLRKTQMSLPGSMLIGALLVSQEELGCLTVFAA